MFTKKNIIFALFVVLFLAGGYYGSVHFKSALPVTYKTPEEKNPYVRFDMEAYDAITENYWASPEMYQNYGLPTLPEIFHLSVEKATGKDVTLATSTRSGVAQMLATTFATATSTDAERALALNILTIATYNLTPAGRDGLLSNKQETALRQNVSNVHPENNLYGDLGVATGADISVVEQAYAQKAAVLQASTSPEAKAELQKLTYDKKVLTNPDSKNLYDQAQIEPTVGNRIIGQTLYIDMSKISPTTLFEFAHIVDAASTTPGLSSMIIDLRGNVGGALDFLQNFLGLFIGQNQYAFDLFHHGDYQVQRTSQPAYLELKRYTDIAILVDNMTQSTAEVTTATFKKFHLAHIVGVTTRGWGTVENTYPLKTDIDPTATYALLLVNSLTLTDANEPIETRGVTPDVDIRDKNWKAELPNFFKSSSLISAIQTEIATIPGVQ